MRLTKQDLAMLIIADNGDQRRSINGIRVEAEDIVATDGKVLARIHKPNNGHGEPPPFDPFTLTADDAKKAKKAIGGRHSELVVVEGALVKLVANQPTGESVEINPSKHPFPDWRRVLKNSVVDQSGPPFRVSFDAHTLRKMAEVVEKTDSRRLSATVTLEIGAKDEAVRFYSGSGEIEGVIMQVRR